MTAAVPSSVEQYLDLLRSAPKGADPALVQDALYDAEEHLRAELAVRAGDSEGDVLARIVAIYGAPEEVAEAYRANEATIQAALRTPVPRPRTSTLGRFFGVFTDPKAYLSLLYMLLALVTGTLYFTYADTGLSMSVGLATLIMEGEFIPGHKSIQIKLGPFILYPYHDPSVGTPGRDFQSDTRGFPDTNNPCLSGRQLSILPTHLPPTVP